MMLLFAAALASAAPMPGLAGSWRSVGLERPVTVEYRGISNDLATVERWRTMSGRETMTVYVADKGDVIATHYCAQGNVATLRAKPSGNGTMTFDFVSAQGVDPGEGVLVKLVLERSAKRLRRIETYRSDGRDSVETFEFVAVP